ncbi:unnamed protein product [Agarophyton chilense]
MSSKPKAPLTTHLRKRFLRDSRTVEKPQPKKPKPDEPDRLFVSDELHEWVKITPEDVRNLQVIDPPQMPIDCFGSSQHTYTMTDDDQRLCHVLDLIAAKHESGNRFLAMTAKLAIRFTQIGKKENINPGLWLHITEMEEELQLGEG